MVRVVLIACALAGCFKPSYDHPACGPNRECPSGFACNAQDVCERPGGGGDDAFVDDSIPDDSGGGDCSVPLACPAPSFPDKQTICGRLFDFENDLKFVAASAGAAKCAAATTEGPCALSLRAYDALSYAVDPANATPLAVGDVHVDECGRYRLSEITLPSNPAILLAIDDRDPARAGPSGVTNTVVVATAKNAGASTRDLEAWIVKNSTVAQWVASGAPPLSGGYFINVFRGHSTGTDNVAGVTVTRMGNPNTANDYYFRGTQTLRQMIDGSATTTGMNGTALVANASIADGTAYSGINALPATCRWEVRPGASLPQVVFIQVLRPVNAVGQTCPL